MWTRRGNGRTAEGMGMGRRKGYIKEGGPGERERGVEQEEGMGMGEGNGNIWEGRWNRCRERVGTTLPCVASGSLSKNGNKSCLYFASISQPPSSRLFALLCSLSPLLSSQAFCRFLFSFITRFFFFVFSLSLPLKLFFFSLSFPLKLFLFSYSSVFLLFPLFSS